MGVYAVKEKLLMQFGREPTLIEWAEAVGMSFHNLQACISSGLHSRNRVIYANFRLVVHIANQYEGKGLNIQDLLQVGYFVYCQFIHLPICILGCQFSFIFI